MQFSIIVPIYNVRDYIEPCVQSIIQQTCQDFEVIFVNDGSTDHSEDVLLPYIEQYDNLHYYEKENGGLSDARNFGVQKVKGDYIIFLDSDDTIDAHLLEQLYKQIMKHPEVDVLKYQCRLIDEHGNLIRNEAESFLDYQTMENCFAQMLDSHIVELACLYAYRSIFWQANAFTYALGKYHEDFGLTPYILAMAEDVIRLDFIGYNYLQRSGSIMNSTDKNKQKSEDMLYHFDRIYQLVEPNNTISKARKQILYSFIANALIARAGLLKGSDLQQYIKALQERHVKDYLLRDNSKRMVKYLIFKLNFTLGVKCFAKER